MCRWESVFIQGSNLCPLKEPQQVFAAHPGAYHLQRSLCCFFLPSGELKHLSSEENQMNKSKFFPMGYAW